MKYTEKQKEFNPVFTKEQIPDIFKGWDEAQFNAVRWSIGVGCCGYYHPDKYSINVAFCNDLRNKIRSGDRKKWMLIIALISLTILISGTISKYFSDANNNKQKTSQNEKIKGDVKQSSSNKLKK